MSRFDINIKHVAINNLNQLLYFVVIFNLYLSLENRCLYILKSEGHKKKILNIYTYLLFWFIQISSVIYYKCRSNFKIYSIVRGYWDLSTSQFYEISEFTVTWCDYIYRIIIIYSVCIGYYACLQICKGSMSLSRNKI